MAAKGPSGVDAQEMFERMGKKLGWFQHGSLEKAMHSLSESAKKKRPTVKSKLQSGTKEGIVKTGHIDSNSDKKKLKPKQLTSNTNHHCPVTKPNLKNKVFVSAANSFNDILSSDSDELVSDEEKENVLKPLPKFSKIKLTGKQLKPKPAKAGKSVLKLCSDSEEEEVEKKTDKSPEKYEVEILEETDIPESPENNGRSRTSDLYDYTIIKNRESIASMTFNFDNLGEPLVESTRIHRRSSPGFKELVDNLSSSTNSSNNDSNLTLSDCGVKANVPDAINVSVELCETFNDIKLKRKDYNLDSSNEDCIEDTRYMTAVEILDAGDSHLRQTETNKYCAEEEKVNVLSYEKTNSLGKGCDTNILDKVAPVKLNIILDSSDSEEEMVEIVDVAVQTEDDCQMGEKECESDDIIPEDVNDNDDLTCWSKTVNVYGEKTIDSSPVGEVIAVEADVYDQETQIHDVEKLKHIESEEKVYQSNTLQDANDVESCVTVVDGDFEKGRKYLDDTKESMYYDVENDVYENPTKCDMTSGTDSDLYEPETIEKDTEVEADNTDDALCSDEEEERAETVDDSDGDEGNAIDRSYDTESSEKSEVEVIDVATQTPQSFTRTGNTKKSSENGEDSSENSVAMEAANISDNESSTNTDTDRTGNHSIDIKQDNTDGNKRMHGVNDLKGQGTEYSFASIAKEKTNSEAFMPEEMDTTKPSFRSRRKLSSDSSGEDDLEAFFQKLKKPDNPGKYENEEESEASSMSMDEFIVEDDEEISCESDADEDDAFYLRETQRKEQQELRKIESRYRGQHMQDDGGSDDDEDDDDVYSPGEESDDSDSDFSSKVYPPSVTKQKKQKYKVKAKVDPVSFCISSDSESDDLPDILETRHHTGSGTQHKSEGGTQRKKKSDISKESSVTGISDSSRNLVNDNDDSSLFKTPNVIKKKGNSKSGTTPKTSDKGKPGKVSFNEFISLSSGSDSDDYMVEVSTGSVGASSDNSVFKTPKLPGKGTKSKTTTPRLGLPESRTSGLSTDSEAGRFTPSHSRKTYTFLESLSNTVPDDCRHPEAKRYVSGFKKLKEELTKHLYSMFNCTVFEGKLPADMRVEWNKRLLKTAGFCAYKKIRKTEERTARIELSDKVCDTADRLRDTLIHEMCHAGCWLINGVNGGHGPFWKYWARQSTKIYPELPAVTRCHSYAINTKYTYRCKTCQYSIGRHSKSMDLKKWMCGKCKGQFELLVNLKPTTPGSAQTAVPTTPRTPNRFALFVKDNYKVVKQRNQDLKHGDVMKELSKMFAESKISS
ncbi:germ cell nuclear acidic protein-like isoform X2 [Mya arenaria]|uniref:germ cell nuclear acidic protein-like isoform X2 n=1 Tax=Mya arenaria TaxID=6604 RepID=UPI0022E00B20|nr:germ cell nuclear acidic protein-like isoform X2 [Mya arenaria]